MFHLEFPEARVTGASPETLVRLAGGRVEVRPIAGTRPRGATADDDERLAAELRADPKELAEHLMLIDLGRNDVGRVAADRHRAGHRADGGRALLARHAHDLARASARSRAGKTLARRAARRVPGRHAVGRAQDPGDGDHRRARAAPARRLRRRGRLRQRTPATWTSRSRSARWSRRGETIHVQAGAGIVADSVPELRVRGDRQQGARGPARGGDGADRATPAAGSVVNAAPDR